MYDAYSNHYGTQGDTKTLSSFLSTYWDNQLPPSKPKPSDINKLKSRILNG